VKQGYLSDQMIKNIDGEGRKKRFEFWWGKRGQGLIQFDSVNMLGKTSVKSITQPWPSMHLCPGEAQASRWTFFYVEELASSTL